MVDHGTKDLNAWRVITARPGLLVYERPDPDTRPERVVVTGHSAGTARNGEEGDHAALFVVSAPPGVLTAEYIGVAMLRRACEILAESGHEQWSAFGRESLVELAPLFDDEDAAAAPEVAP